jgi:hypothetical protein
MMDGSDGALNAQKTSVAQNLVKQQRLLNQHPQQLR